MSTTRGIIGLLCAALALGGGAATADAQPVRGPKERRDDRQDRREDRKDRREDRKDRREDLKDKRDEKKTRHEELKAKEAKGELTDAEKTELEQMTQRHAELQKRHQEIKAKYEENKQKRQERRRERRAAVVEKWGPLHKKPAAKAELTLHARRMARLHRLRYLAQTTDREEAEARIDKLIAAEKARHDARMTKVKEGE